VEIWENVALVRHVQLLAAPTNAAKTGEVDEAWQSPEKLETSKLVG
jgi:hypothetical protein